jgi:hypothetical protein
MDRLKGILEMRLADRVVKEVVWGYESSEQGDSTRSDRTQSADDE